MEIRTDFTALVLPSATELQLATERARLAAEGATQASRRERGILWFARRRSAHTSTRHAVAR